MGLFALNPAYRFLTDLSGDLVESEARIFLSGFFEAMGTRAVHLAGPPSTDFIDLIEKATGIPFDGTSDREEVLVTEAAARACAARLKRCYQVPNVSRGISFGLDEPPISPRNRWHLFLHRGPLPLLSVTITDGSAFRPPRMWEQVLINTGAAHVVWNRKVHCGTQDNIYLLRKRQQIFPSSTSRSTGEAIEGGVLLRKLCRDIALKNGQEEVYRLSSWQWAQRRFLRNFDKLLIKQVGTDKLTEIFAAMGIDLNMWLRASNLESAVVQTQK